MSRHCARKSVTFVGLDLQNRCFLALILANLYDYFQIWIVFAHFFKSSGQLCSCFPRVSVDKCWAQILFTCICSGNSLTANKEYRERIPNPKTFASVFQRLRTNRFLFYAFNRQRWILLQNVLGFLGSNSVEREELTTVSLARRTWYKRSQGKSLRVPLSEGARYTVCRLCIAFEVLSLASRKPSYSKFYFVYW